MLGVTEFETAKEGIIRGCYFLHAEKITEAYAYFLETLHINILQPMLMLTVLYGKPYNFQNILFPLNQNKKKS